MEKIQINVAEQTLRLLNSCEWNHITLDMIFKKLKTNKQKLSKYFKNKYDLLENINQYFDHQIMIKIKSIDQSTPRDMLFEIIMLRFDLLNKHRKSILRIFNFFKKNPRNFIFLIPCFINSSELMSNIANIKIKGFKGRIRIKGVLVVYLSTFLTWVNDDSFSLDKTMNVLDNYLKKFEGIAKLIH